MHGVDSSCEALAFIPVNLSPLLSAASHNLIWAWVALFTAVFSFWRLRTSSHKTTSSSQISLSSLPPPPTTNTTKTMSFKVIDEEKIREKADEEDEEKVVLTGGTHHSDKFFTVYYENDDDDGQIDDGDHHGHDDDDNNDIDECMVIKRWGSTGSTIEMRSSSSPSEFDLGWYNYQDRKVINGSVVRLWEDERESVVCGNASPQGCRRRCFIGVTTQLALA